jgi:hypothetical protein
MGVNIKHTTILLSIIAIFIFTNLTPTVSAAATTTLTIASNDTADLGELTKSTNLTRTLTITYSHSGFFRPEGGFLSLFRPNQRTPSTLTLSVASKPSWCAISFSQTNFSIPITRILRAQETPNDATMTINANIDNVTAKTTDTITIQADTAVNGDLPAATTTIEFTISVDFIPSLDVSIVKDTTSSLSSNEWGNLTLNFNNTSNEEIVVAINYTKIPEYQTPGLNLPNDFSINQDDSIQKTIPFKVMSLNKTINTTQKMELEITYSMASDATETGGEPILIQTLRTIQFNPAEEDVLDLAPAFIGIAVVFLLIIGFFSFLTLRRQQ